MKVWERAARISSELAGGPRGRRAISGEPNSRSCSTSATTPSTWTRFSSASSAARRPSDDDIVGCRNSWAIFASPLSQPFVGVIPAVRMPTRRGTKHRSPTFSAELLSWERNPAMAANRPGEGSSNSTLYFIVGALIIAVLIIGWFMYGREGASPHASGRDAEEPAMAPTCRLLRRLRRPTPAPEPTPGARACTQSQPPATPEPDSDTQLPSRHRPRRRRRRPRLRPRSVGRRDCTREGAASAAPFLSLAVSRLRG